MIKNAEIYHKKFTDWNEFLKTAKIDFYQRMIQKVHRYPKGNLGDFNFQTTLGEGAFGRVMRAERISTHVPYAAKLLSKQFIVKTKQVANTRNEKKLLESFKFPFTLNLEFFFQDNVYLYFIMPLMEGGDVFNLLRRKGKFDEHLSRFYAAQVLLALEYLHYLDLLYRDLKPENLLLDREGYLRVADYGFVKQVTDRTYTFCGTPEYIAPEIIQSKGYGKAADYWSFGILLYEFNCGITPFYADEQMGIYEKIVVGKYLVVEYFSAELKDIIKNLLQNDLSRRFGNLRRGIQDIKDHKWFTKIKWLSVVNKVIKPPFVPPASGFFDKYEEKPLEKLPNDPYRDIFANF